MDEAPANGLHIAVLVKHVPDAQFDRHISGDDLTTVRSESILSELDEYALEAALQLVETHGGPASGHRITAITMGPAGAVAAVKKSLQIGADYGVHLTDEALGGSDASATSKALAALLRHVGPFDLILTGMASSSPAHRPCGHWAMISSARPAEYATSAAEVLSSSPLSLSYSAASDTPALPSSASHAARTEPCWRSTPCVISS